MPLSVWCPLPSTTTLFPTLLLTALFTMEISSCSLLNLPFRHVGANSTITSSDEKLYFAAISVRILLIKFMSFTNKTSFLGIPEDSISPSYIKLFLTTLSEKYLLLDKYRFTSFPEILVLYFANSLDSLLSAATFL